MTVHSYIIGNLKKDVETYVAAYETFTWIDDFMSNASKPWFYEYTIQGFIYSNLVRQFDYAVKGGKNLFFLEQPYLKTSNVNRADLMIVEFNTQGDIVAKSAIEIKTDFLYQSIYTDMEVLAHYVTQGNISVGYGIFFGTSQQIIDDTVKDLKKEPKLKQLFTDHKLFAVGMIGNPE